MLAHQLIYTLFLMAPALISAAPTFKARRLDYFGPAVSMGPSQVDIIHSVTTLVPGRAPLNQIGGLYIWPGMSNGTGDLIQTTMDSWTGNDCGQADYQWCGEASVYSPINGQTNAPSQLINPDDRIRIEYIRGDVQPNGYEWAWDQKVYRESTGEMISTLTSISGTMRGWGTATECQADCVGTIDPHYYYNTTITLEGPDLSFGTTIGAGNGATYTGFAHNEDASVYTIDEIYIPIMPNPDGDATTTVSETASQTETASETASATVFTSATTLEDSSPTSAVTIETDLRTSVITETETTNSAYPTSVVSTSDDALPTSVASTSDDALPTSAASTSDDALPTSAASTSDDALPTSASTTDEVFLPTSASVTDHNLR